MKFGRDLHRYQIPEWTDFYLNYRSAETLVKQGSIVSHESKAGTDAAELFVALQHGLSKVEAFYIQKLQNIRRKIEVACSCSLEALPSRSLDHIDAQEAEQLLASFLELQSWLCQLRDFGNLNRESLRRICRKIKKTQAFSAYKHFDEFQAYKSQFASQKECLELLAHCKSFINRLRVATSNIKSIPSQLSLFLQSSSAKFPLSFVHLDAICVAIKADNFLSLDRILEEQDCRDLQSLSGSLLLALLKYSVAQGSIQCINILLSRLSGDTKDIRETANILHSLVISVGRMKKGPDRRDYGTLVFFTKQVCSRRWFAFIEKDQFQRLPLHYAAFYDLSDYCRTYLDCMAESDELSNSILEIILAEDIEAYTALSLAVIGGKTDVTRVLLRACEEKSGPIGLSENSDLQNNLSVLLGIALKSGFGDIARMLIAHHANTDFQSLSGETALYIASQMGFDDLVKAVLHPPVPQRTGIDLVEPVRCWTPLFIACIEGHLSTVKYLLEAGANPNLRDSFGWTPKEHAAYRGHIKVAELLSKIPSTLSSDPVHNASQARRDVQNGILSYSREKRQQTSSELKNSEIFQSRELLNHLDSHILVTLGPSDIRSNLSVVNPEDFQVEAGFAFEISATGAEEAPVLVHLPILNEKINEPWIFTVREPDKTKLKFRLLRIEDYNSERNTIVGSGIALLGSIKQGLSLKRESLIRDYTIPILDTQSSNLIASVTFSFLTVTPFKHFTIPPIVTHGFWKNGGSTKVIGHRGSGANSTARTNLQIGENTIQSFLTATAHGASCVEFDVQLTSDFVPIIFHDFLVMETGGNTPLHTLSYDQFMHLSKSQAPRGYLSGMAEARYLEKANAQENSRKKPRSHSLNAYDEYRSQDLNERMRLTEEGMQNNIKGNIRGHSIQEPSTTLEQLLTTLPDSIAFNLEIKYPMLWETQDRHMESSALEPNFLLTTILNTLTSPPSKRNITLSSFSPEICILLSQKQSQYPILFITKAGSVPTGDIRAASLQQAVHFAKSWRLAGIVSLADPLVMCPGLVKHVKASGLVCASYGDLNDSPECALIQATAGIDGLMVNKVRLISQTFAKAAAAAAAAVQADESVN